MADDFSHFIPDRDNVHRTLGIEHVLVSPDKVILALEVSPTVHQPFGILHGGVSALLAEGAASLGGVVDVAPNKVCVGTELNISHLRPIRSGRLTATATPVRKGRTVQVWGIELTDDRGRLISTARCSLQVVDTPAE